MLFRLTALLTRASSTESRGREFSPVKTAGINVPIVVAVTCDVLEANGQVVQGPWAMWNIRKM